MSNKDTYWFKDEDARAVVRQLGNHTDRWVEYAANPVSQSWIRNIVAYYSCLLEPNDWQSSLGYVGEQGELIRMGIPQARSIIRQTVSVLTKERLAFKAIAETQGADVMADLQLGDAVAEQIINNEEMDRKNEAVLEHAMVTGTGFWRVVWATDEGSPYAATDEGVIAYEGKVEVTVPLIQDVTYDVRIPNPAEWQWAQCRVIRNRWDLVAQHPDLKEEIIALPEVMEDYSMRSRSQEFASENDLVYVYEVYHKPTPAMPMGRMIMYSDDRTIYFDGPNYYGCIPIIPVMPEPIYGMGYGYPILSNLLPSQEMFDHSMSAIATNHSNLAVQNVACPRGANVDVMSIMGMNYIMYTQQNASGGGKPEPLNLLQSAPETYKFADVLAKYMLQVSPINSTIRGDLPPGVTSGTAIATLTANSLEFLNGLSKTVQLALERVITLAVNIESKFAMTERSVTMEGKNNKSSTKNYVGDDLKNVKKFKMQRINPLMQTLAGRLDTAEKLLQNGVVKSTQDYVSILDGAPLSQLTEGESSENELIQAENTALMQREPVIALITDTHPLHILKHKALLNDPAVRFSNEMVQEVLAHIEDHARLQQTGDPFLMAMATTGKMPEGGPPPPPGGQGGSGAGGPPTVPEDQQVPNVAEPAADEAAGAREALG